jgi:hypothetical protein
VKPPVVPDFAGVRAGQVLPKNIHIDVSSSELADQAGVELGDS